MENTRFLLYILVISIGLGILTAIKALRPHDEPESSVDYIGIEMYRPIFFGEPNQISSSVSVLAEEEVEDISSQVRDDETAEAPSVSTIARTEALTDEAFFEQMIADYRANVLSENPYRPDVVVRYYKHLKDGDMANVLVDYGFYLHVRPVPNTYEFENLRSNVIYHGSEFPERDLQLITYLLIQNGIEIKEIRKFRDYSGWKNKSIEIGASALLENEPVLTLSQVRSVRVP